MKRVNFDEEWSKGLDIEVGHQIGVYYTCKSCNRFSVFSVDAPLYQKSKDTPVSDSYVVTDEMIDHDRKMSNLVRKQSKERMDMINTYKPEEVL